MGNIINKQAYLDDYMNLNINIKKNPHDWQIKGSQREELYFVNANIRLNYHFLLLSVDYFIKAPTIKVFFLYKQVSHAV